MEREGLHPAASQAFLQTNGSVAAACDGHVGARAKSARLPFSEEAQISLAMTALL
jgi:hypothetical protein